MRQSVLVVFLLMVVCLAGIASAAPGEVVQPPQDLALLKAAIFQAPAQAGAPATEEGLIGKLSPQWKRAEDCSNYTLPCAIYQCDCRNRCAPCGGVQSALCFNVCNCVNPGC